MKDIWRKSYINEMKNDSRGNERYMTKVIYQKNGRRGYERYMTKVIYQQEALRRSDKIRYDMLLSADISWDKCPLFDLYALTRNVLSA